MLQPFEYVNDKLMVLDQSLLPQQKVWLCCATALDVATVITAMAVRGAPAIAIAGAYGMALAHNRGDDLAVAYKALIASRPTAVHLRKTLARMLTVLDGDMLQEARRIHEEDRAINQALGKVGADLLPAKSSVYHHCNTGALATGGWGTALGIVRSAVEADKGIHVWVGETRPYLQGARLTTWELMADQIPCTLVTDSMASKLMADGRVNAVLVGCDRVAENGDVANKIGTLGLAIIADYYNVPFYVAMPLSALDTECKTGSAIPIEDRPATEMTGFDDVTWTPADVKAYNPGFDITPAKLVTAWVTERGLWHPLVGIPD